MANEDDKALPPADHRITIELDVYVSPTWARQVMEEAMKGAVTNLEQGIASQYASLIRPATGTFVHGKVAQSHGE